MKRLFLAGIALSLALLTACGQSSKSADNGKANYSKSDVAYETAVADADTGKAADGGTNESGQQSIAAAPNSSLISAKAQKKIIKNASIDIETKNVTECYDKILNYVSANGGYEYSQSLSNDSEYTTMNAVIKVSPEKLDDVIKFARDCGNIINTRISSTDITAEYTDTQIRLENKKKNLQEYYKYYERATTIEDTLMLQKEIDNLTAEIESYEGQIKMWNELADESTLELYIQQVNDPIKIKKDVKWNAISPKDMVNYISNGFTTVINVLFSLVEWLLIILAAISPILLIAGIILVIIKFRKGKKKLKTPQDLPNKENQENQQI